MAKKSKWVNMSPKVRTVTRDAMMDTLEYLRDEANKRVPHDEGILELSGDYVIDSTKAEGVVFYDTPYAVRLHEHPEYNFQGGREGKWLENTFKLKGDKAKKYMANKIDQALR